MKTALITGGSKGIGKAIKEELEKQGIKVISWSKSEGQDLMIKNPILPKIDILINNVGGMGTSEYEDSDECMEKNFGIMKRLIHQYLEQKTTRDYRRVITIASIYGTYPGENPWFSASKAAQIMYMRSMAKKKLGITFNCVSPTEVADAGTPKKVKLKSKDIAKLVAFLCSDDAEFINGQNIVIGEYK
jgi:NAD(P)-dependent dehydrogenase (short-subunit alcohol dehydrogenase family)